MVYFSVSQTSEIFFLIKYEHIVQNTLGNTVLNLILVGMSTVQIGSSSKITTGLLLFSRLSTS